MVRIKICGVTTPEDAVHAAECGADALGLNFYPRSPRFLSPEQAEALVRALPPFTATVGVFVQESVSCMQTVAMRYGLRAVQTYSDTPLAVDFFPAAQIPAFRVQDAATLTVARQCVQSVRPAAILVDSYVPGEPGGTGHRAPWELLAGFDAGVPLILAGGLTPDNVAEAIRLVRPWGVDVASGVESVPGRKDPGRVRAFIQAVRSVESRE
ncbi:MAG: phosphoribosylanthranilate isomerase [Bacteroidales bacterium]|nr:phosphoribosylanthranilate isomerase [Bacteroidales bacterium]